MYILLYSTRFNLNQTKKCPPQVLKWNTTYLIFFNSYHIPNPWTAQLREYTIGQGIISYNIYTMHIQFYFILYYNFSPSELWKQHEEKGGENLLADYAPCMKHEDVDGSFLQAKQQEFVQNKLCERLSGEKIDKL